MQSLDLYRCERCPSDINKVKNSFEMVLKKLTYIYIIDVSW